jgi:hypothetical protein
VRTLVIRRGRAGPWTWRASRRRPTSGCLPGGRGRGLVGGGKGGGRSGAQGGAGRRVHGRRRPGHPPRLRRPEGDLPRDARSGTAPLPGLRGEDPGRGQALRPPAALVHHDQPPEPRGDGGLLRGEPALRPGPSRVHFFRQGRMPAVDFSGKILLRPRAPRAFPGRARRLAAGPGAQRRPRPHGRRGHRHAELFPGRQPPGALRRPGVHRLAPPPRSEMSSKTVPKAYPEEKLGHFCVQRGKLVVIEYSDLPLALQRETDPATGRLRYGREASRSTSSTGSSSAGWRGRRRAALPQGRQEDRDRGRRRGRREARQGERGQVRALRLRRAAVARPGPSSSRRRGPTISRR